MPDQTRPEIPENATACLLLNDGKIFYGQCIGSNTSSFGEICFNTGMTGYQEVMTDPSYAGQIITFTFPHIGNTGCNDEDIESTVPAARGLVVRECITEASSWRSNAHFDSWLKQHDIMGICGVDTRALTRHIRTQGAQNVAIFAVNRANFPAQLKEMQEKLAGLPSLKGLELAKGVTTAKSYGWEETRWHPEQGYGKAASAKAHVVAIDYGEKRNILRSLADQGCKVTVVSATTSAEDILKMKPDGIFLSNGPGDPAATGEYAIPVIRKLIDEDLPVFGICLGHQLLALALGGKTEKMHQGHRGANHPVKNLETGAVEITSQNHGFCVVADSLPGNVKLTHTSLFDGCVEGFRVTDKPVFAVQYHPESSPGPHDSQYLFRDFMKMMKAC